MPILKCSSYFFSDPKGVRFQVSLDEVDAEGDPVAVFESFILASSDPFIATSLTVENSFQDPLEFF